MSEITSFGIFPALSVARVGDSDEYFVGPEVPGIYAGAKPGFTFRSTAEGPNKNKLKKHGARFRIFGYNKDGVVVKELRTDQIKDLQITWTVELGNKKCSHQQFLGRAQKDEIMLLRNPSIKDRKSLEAVDTKQVSAPGQQAKLSGKLFNTTEVNVKPVDINMGTLIMENTGRLVVLGGDGKSGTVKDNLISNYANNDGWYDDVSDGPITARVVLNGSELPAKEGLGRSWIIVGPPKFAPATPPIMSLFTRIHETQHGSNAPQEVRFYRDVLPVLSPITSIAWVNQKAWRGHGPSGYGNFLDQLKDLSDPSDAAAPKRQNVLQKIRKPEEYANQWEKDGQAYEYFMPILSGDAGDATNTKANTFLTVTAGQYAILQKWADGEFVVEDSVSRPVDYLAIARSSNKWELDELIPDPKLQPDALNKAALEWSAGGAFFPGIEMTFISCDPATFGSQDFRIADGFTAGDISKWMALPWQADFYECADHWWPSQRPDDVLPLYPNGIKLLDGTYLNVKEVNPKDIKPEQFVAWARGFRNNEPTRQNVHWGDLDMVDNWASLGFIKPHEDNLNVLVETERVFRTSEPDEFMSLLTTKDIGGLLQGALLIELYTIPAYLYAMYSIKDDGGNGTKVKGIIQQVVIEEMLHASLVANILTSITDAKGNFMFNPIFYCREMTPFYPNPLPYHDNNSDPITVQLAPGDGDTLQAFIAIESPAVPPPNTMMFMASSQAQAEFTGVDNYKQFSSIIFAKYPELQNLAFPSIAAYYESTLSFMESEYKKGNIQFKDSDFQLKPGMGFAPRRSAAGGLVTIDSFEKANAAIAEIIAQGEGGQPHEQEECHWTLFKQAYALWQAKEYEIWPVITNPTPSDYQEHPRVLNLAVAFNATYSYLMLLLEKSWGTQDLEVKRRLLIGGMPIVMRGILAPIAEFMVTLPIGSGQNAGPTFSFYNFIPDGTSPKQQLIAELKKAASGYPTNSMLANLPSVAATLPDFYQYGKY